MSQNTRWQIAFGDYDLAVDRKTLTYTLTETKTGTIWSDGLSVGWLELEETASGERVRYAFGEMRLVSLSEKAGSQGKRILFGLDCQGVPVDLYFTCSQQEIQLTAEASRDTRTHRVQSVCLFPGLVSVPDDGVSYLVLPHREGALLFAKGVPETSNVFPIWDANEGVIMPFIGAVRNRAFDAPTSALALIIDSAYGAFSLERQPYGSAALDTHFTRDPERRRLDVRLIVFPEKNHVAIARAYRDKLIGDKNHVTLRKKLREKPALDFLIGCPVVHGNNSTVSDLAKKPLEDRAETYTSRWDDMDERLEALRELSKNGEIVCATGGCDWSAIVCDLWLGVVAARYPLSFAHPLPLYATVYHDSVVCAFPPCASESDAFRRGLLSLCPPNFEDPRRDEAVLAPLHQLSFAAFLTEHRFLTTDLLVEEARYSNGTHVLINGSKTEAFENERTALPPGGFYAEHPLTVMHDALRVDEETFATRAFRIARSLDGKPLVESADILHQEFPESPE